MRTSKSPIKQEFSLVIVTQIHVQMLMITFRSEEALNPWRLFISRFRTTFDITHNNIVFSHEQIWNCEEMSKNASLINSGFLEGTYPLCSNWNKECRSAPACCKIRRWRHYENYFTLMVLGGGQGFLPLKTELQQKLLFDIIVKRVRGCTQTFPEPGFLLSSTFWILYF